MFFTTRFARGTLRNTEGRPQPKVAFVFSHALWPLRSLVNEVNGWCKFFFRVFCVFRGKNSSVKFASIRVHSRLKDLCK